MSRKKQTRAEIERERDLLQKAVEHAGRAMQLRISTGIIDLPSERAFIKLCAQIGKLRGYGKLPKEAA